MSSTWLARWRAACDLAHHHGDEVGIVPPRAEQDLDDALELLVRPLVGRRDRLEAAEELAPVLAEEGLEHLVLRREVVVEEAVRDACFLGDVADARGVEAVAREDAHRGVEDPAPLLLGARLALALRALLSD